MSSEGPRGAAAAQRNAQSNTVVEKTQRAQWLRTAVFGAIEGLMSVSSLMLGVGAFNPAGPAMVVSGLADLVAGACCMALTEFICLYSQRERKKKPLGGQADDCEEKLPNALQAAGVSALAFAMGGVLPLLAGGFIGLHWVRMGVVLALSSLELAGLWVAEAMLTGLPVARSTLRGVIGGWAAMFVTFGIVRIFRLAFKAFGEGP